MIRFLVALFFLFLLSFSAVASDACDREVPDDLYELKENHIPVEYPPDPFALEVTDLAVLILLMGLAAGFSLKHKRIAWLTLLMVVGLSYFGFFRGGCICPVGATTNFFIGLAAPELIGKVVAVLFLLPLIFAFFFGRVFCSSACPLGAVQHLLARKKGIRLPARLNAVVRLLPVGMLLATIWGALRGGYFLACKLDVYKLLFFTGYAWIDQILLWIKGALVETQILWVGDVMAWFTLLAVLVVGFFVSRPFCRFVCPYSVLLGLASVLGLRRRRIDVEACVNCRLCEKHCPVQAIDGTRISDFHCIQCGRCDDSCRKDALSR